jgi:hypothetical protein
VCLRPTARLFGKKNLQSLLRYKIAFLRELENRAFFWDDIVN